MRASITASLYNELTIKEKTKLLNYYRFMGFNVYSIAITIRPNEIILIKDDHEKKYVLTFIDIGPCATISYEEIQKLIELSPV